MCSHVYRCALRAGRHRRIGGGGSKPSWDSRSGRSSRDAWGRPAPAPRRRCASPGRPATPTVCPTRWRCWPSSPPSKDGWRKRRPCWQRRRRPAFPTTKASSWNGRAGSHWLEGDFGASAQSLLEAVAWHPEGLSRRRAHNLGPAVAALTELGRLGEARSLTETLRAISGDQRFVPGGVRPLARRVRCLPTTVATRVAPDRASAHPLPACATIRRRVVSSSCAAVGTPAPTRLGPDHTAGA